MSQEQCFQTFHMCMKPLGLLAKLETLIQQGWAGSAASLCYCCWSVAHTVRGKELRNEQTPRGSLWNWHFSGGPQGQHFQGAPPGLGLITSEVSRDWISLGNSTACLLK